MLMFMKLVLGEAPVDLLPDPPPWQGRALKPPGGRPRLHPDLPGVILKHENLFDLHFLQSLSISLLKVLGFNPTLPCLSNLVLFNSILE